MFGTETISNGHFRINQKNILQIKEIIFQIYISQMCHCPNLEKRDVSKKKRTKWERKIEKK